MEKIKPITLKDNSNGDVYTLEFNKESVRFAESRGFNFDEIGNKPMTLIPDLFYYAFRMHHINVSRSKTDKILFEELGGLSPTLIERLGQLYAEPFNALTNTEEEPKNPKMTVEL